MTASPEQLGLDTPWSLLPPPGPADLGDLLACGATSTLFPLVTGATAAWIGEKLFPLGPLFI